MVDFLLGPEYFDLPHVGIFARMLVLQNDDLDIDGGDIIFLGVVEQLCFQGDGVPPSGFLQLEVLNFLEVLHVVAGSD